MGSHQRQVASFQRLAGFPFKGVGPVGLRKMIMNYFWATFNFLNGPIFQFIDFCSGEDGRN